MIILNTFESELREIARAMMRHATDRDLGAPKGANIRVEDTVGTITIYWSKNGRTFDVTTFVPVRLWEATKVAKKQAEFIAQQVRGMHTELAKLKRDNLNIAA